MEQVTITLWIVGVIVVSLIGQFLSDRLFFGREGVRGYWPRALLLTV